MKVFRCKTSMANSFFCRRQPFLRSTFSGVIHPSHLMQHRIQSTKYRLKTVFFFLPLNSHEHCFAHKICTRRKDFPFSLCLPLTCASFFEQIEIIFYARKFTAFYLSRLIFIFFFFFNGIEFSLSKESCGIKEKG